MTARLNRRARRRTVAAALATLGVGALLTATASATWAAPIAGSTSASATLPDAVGADTTSTPAPTGTPTVTVNGSTVTITRDLAQVQAMCARVPVAQKRIAADIARIQGGSDVQGSVAWLQARADAQRAAGHADAAKRIDDRAALRSDRVTALTKRGDRLAKAEQNICVPVAAQTGTGTSS